MSSTQIFVLCLMIAEYVVLGLIAGVIFREDIKEWLRKKFRKEDCE